MCARMYVQLVVGYASPVHAKSNPACVAALHRVVSYGGWWTLRGKEGGDTGAREGATQPAAKGDARGEGGGEGERRGREEGGPAGGGWTVGL